MNINIKTQYKTNASGAGKIFVTGNGSDGKRHQMTVPYDHGKGRRGRHGSAAGQFAAKFLTLDDQKALDSAVLMGRMQVEDLGNEGMAFKTTL